VKLADLPTEVKEELTQEAIRFPSIKSFLVWSDANDSYVYKPYTCWKGKVYEFRQEFLDENENISIQDTIVVDLIELELL